MSTRDFDEAYYRKRYPDVAEAIDNDRFPSAHAHYQRFGRIEGRFPTRAAEDEAALDIKVGKHVLVNGAALLKKGSLCRIHMWSLVLLGGGRLLLLLRCTIRASTWGLRIRSTTKTPF